jgi:TonB-dependent starch-binding outer membrane protein SusC
MVLKFIFQKTYWHIMKLTFVQMILMAIFCTMTYAHDTKAQEILNSEVYIKPQSESLKNILSKIEKQTKVRFVYSDTRIPIEKEVYVNANGQTLGTVLKDLLLPINIRYQVSGNYIVLSKLKNEISENIFSKEAQVLPDFIITGMVTDENGGPLIGVSVLLEGTQKGTITDVNGEYTLELDEADKNGSLVFSYVGFETQTIAIEGRNTLNIIMKEAAGLLDEVVVVGYGSQTKQKISTAISSVKVDDIDQGAGYNPVKMLQGRTSGVNIVSGSGIPGTKPVVLIRGVGSISGASAPLYVVDGVPNEGGYPNINPNDIESMEVLKDASAAAIYGSRANSGVILITTKSGKSGKTSVSFDTWMGIGTIANDIEMANSQEYTNVMQLAVDNYNKQRNTTLKFYTPQADQIEETDWTKVISRT